MWTAVWEACGCPTQSLTSCCWQDWTYALPQKALGHHLHGLFSMKHRKAKPKSNKPIAFFFGIKFFPLCMKFSTIKRNWTDWDRINSASFEPQTFMCWTTNWVCWVGLYCVFFFVCAYFQASSSEVSLLLVSVSDSSKSVLKVLLQWENSWLLPRPWRNPFFLKPFLLSWRKENNFFLFTIHLYIFFPDLNKAFQTDYTQHHLHLSQMLPIQQDKQWMVKVKLSL